MPDFEAVFSSSRLEKVKINVNDLRVGMYVCELDRPWLETDFLFQGFELKSAADINVVKKVCHYVYIDTGKTKAVAVPAVTNSAFKTTKAWLDSKGKTPERKRSFSQEIEQAEAAHHSASNLIRSFMDDIRLGGRVNTAAARAVVAQCVQSVLNTPDALMWLTQLKNKDAYTAEHSMNVCIMSIALGRHIGMAVEELNLVGLCGMMHDMGKMRIPPEILNKPSELEPEELAIMQTHTVEGWKLLTSSKDMYPGAVDVALTHHEQLDGNGYSRGLTDEQITPYAKMVAIADIYDAVTSDRVYQKGRSHLDALKILHRLSAYHLDASLTIRFIDCLGIYPAGSFVELNTGEVGIVVEINPKQKIRPKIMILLDAGKKAVRERLIDLAEMGAGDGGQKYTIKKIVRADDYSIDIRRLYNDGFLSKGFAAV